MPWSRTTNATRSSTMHAPISTGSSGPEYLIALSSRFTSALRIWRGSQKISRSGGSGPTSSGTEPASAAACTTSTDSEMSSRTGIGPRRRLLRLDRAEVEQVVDDLREPVGFAHDPLREPLHDRDVVGRGHRLREQAERADRRLQLVTHVRDEVAPDALDPPRLGDVARERDRTDDLAVAAQRERAQLQHLARRSVERKLAFRAVAGQRLLQQLRDRVLGEHLAGAGAGETTRHRVAHDLTTDAVDDDDRVARLVERGEQPVLHRLRLQHPVLRLASLLGDGIDQRQILGNVDRVADPRQLPSGRRELASDDDDDRPPDQTDDDEECRHDRRQASRTQPNRPVM